jgi:cytochrome c5
LIGFIASALFASAAENAFPAASQAPRPQSGWQRFSKSEPSAPFDEALGGRTLGGTQINPRNENCFPTDERNLFADVDMLRGADGKLHSVFEKSNAIPDKLSDAIRGQNTWLLWGEGDEAFWGWLLQNNYGITDFLVLLDSREREHRFRDAGLVNQPGMKPQKDPAKKILGLYLDQNDGARGSWPQRRPAGCPSEPFKVINEPHYQEALTALATDDADPYIYGYPSGIVGLRLFPNPDFFADTTDAARARAYWKKQVEDQPQDDYYEASSEIAADPRLVRPFRVSMTCAFCHIGPHPLNPPKNPEAPDWANLSSTIGAQYWTGSKAFSNLKGPKSFLFQLVQSWRPGTLDTSLVSTDQINNPNTMNAIWDVPSRLQRAGLNPPEKQSTANLLIPSIEDPAANTRHVPRALLDGSDSVGLFGALSRVYLNIGTYYEQWIRLHNPLIGLRAQRPFELTTIEDRSVFWRVAEKQRVPELAAFFLYVNKAGETVTAPMKLASLPDHPTIDGNQVAKGRAVFIQNCAICHSSKQPKDFELLFTRDWDKQEVVDKLEPGQIALPMDFEEWETFKASDAYAEYVERIEAEAGEASATFDPFLDHNYLSTDIRIPVTLVGTNSSRAVATNAMRGQVWANFSSDEYKRLPEVGPVHFYNPYSAKTADEWGNNDVYYPPKGGPGYYRPASLVGLWATAPFLHNNALGRYTHDPSVEGRLQAFDDAIDKLLWKKHRVATKDDPPGDLRFAHKELTGHDPGFIYRTTAPSWIDFPAPFIRPLLVGVMGEGWTSFLTRYLWYVLAGIAILFALFGRQQHAGFGLLLVAVLLGIVLRVTGIDRIYPVLWWIPGLAVLLAFLLWIGPQLRVVAPIFFSLFAAAFLLVAWAGGAWVDGRLGGLKIGPVPRGTPVNLLMSLNPQAPIGDLVNAISGLTRGLLSVRKLDRDNDRGARDRENSQDYEVRALQAFEAEAGLPLLKASKCPDFVLDRGHWFAEALSDDEKNQLKAFLKTL